ncbi:MAG: class I SAM-dependent methyltransferase [Bacteroidales bacterium]|nr:class I SAM-dependent methyltransferase [Bacteroidales bacterium]
MAEEINYTFRDINSCEMCGAGLLKLKVLGKRLNKSQGINPKRKTGIFSTIVKCSDCGLIFSNPQPVPQNISDHYNISPDNYWKEEQLKQNDNFFLGFISWLKNLIVIKDGIKALDVGAGLGTFMECLQKENIDAYGMEPSEFFFKTIIERKEISRDKIKNVSIENAEYPENYFDFICFGAVLEHLYNPADAINKAMKWLKPNGVIFIEVPNADWLTSKLINFYYKITSPGYVCNLSPMHNPYHLYEFTLTSFQKFCSRYGYEIADHDYDVCKTFLPKYFDFILKPYMKLTKKGMIMEVWLRKK